MKRLTRVQQKDRNRSLVLSAARQLFIDRGYQAATVEQIADEAGFSRGVVYSQFDSKADLFFALLEERIEERAKRTAELVETMHGRKGLAELLEHLARADDAVPGWLRLVIEFRVHASRDPELNRRYARVHARTVHGLAAALTRFAERPGDELPLPPHQLAEVLLALSSGRVLEQAADPAALGGHQFPALLSRLLSRLLMPPAATADGG